MTKKVITRDITGLVIGFANGLFGSGGGAIAVYAIQKKLKVETHKSHATAIAVMLPLSLISLFIYSGKSEVDLMTAFVISAGGIIGGIIGAKTLTKIPKNLLHKIFGTFMILSAIWILL